jgi:exopolysaccharide production protein ExoQ
LAPLAFLLCLAFIFGALGYDTKECRRISLSLWIPVIWLAVGLSKPFTYWVHPNKLYYLATQFTQTTEYDPTRGSPLDRNFYLLLLCVGLIVLYKRKARISFDYRTNIWIYLFYVYALVSVSWSNYPDVSLKRWIKLAGEMIMVLVIQTEDNNQEAVDHVFRRCAILLIPLSVFLVKYKRTIGVYYDFTGASISWRGVCEHKNGLGLLCAFMGIYLVWRLLKKWPNLRAMSLDGLLLLLTLYLFRGARSATSYVVFTMGVLVLVIEALFKGDTKKLRAALIISLVLVLVLQALSIIVLGQPVTSLIFSATGRDSTYTGRAPLWRELIKIGGQRPFLGAGYGSFWMGNLTHNLWDQFEWRPTNGHNGYIDIFVDLGLVGLIILILLIVRAYKRITTGLRSNRDISGLFLAFFVMILFHNVTESSLAKPTSFLWLLLLLTATTVVNKADST